jgi:hypothetical protein
MKIKVSIVAFIACLAIAACNNKPDAPKAFCSDPCLKDTLKYTIEDPGKPYVYISAKDCTPDTILWSTKYSETNRKMSISELLGRPVAINKEFVSCYIKDTSFAILQLNDCSSFRGYILKLPFNKSGSISKKSSALTPFDKKYAIGEGLICYADNTFLYAEDMVTGKVEKLLLSDKQLDIDWENIHNTFDSVNVSRTRIFVNLKADNETKPLEKTISL